MDEKTRRRLYSVYNNIQNRKGTKNKFGDSGKFIEWYVLQEKKQKGKCYYCHTKQKYITELITSGIIKSKRFVTRGRSLEVERLKSDGNYSPANCVLICYFCNNDKSDVVSSEDYLKYFAKHKRRYLMDKYKQYLKGK
jgi:5-methylcytosine-specific restriction endonuclease McrA